MATVSLVLHRINPLEHEEDYRTAHHWMGEQTHLYSEIVGLKDFEEFVHHKVEQVDFALRNDGQLIAFASLVLRGRKVCEFELITPPRPQVRSILALLRWLQCDYFETLRFLALFTSYPDDPKYDRSRRLCRMFGWREPRPGYFEYTIYDHLRATNG